jgi:hypothetical protein
MMYCAMVCRGDGFGRSNSKEEFRELLRPAYQLPLMLQLSLVGRVWLLGAI